MGPAFDEWETASASAFLAQVIVPIGVMALGTHYFVGACVVGLARPEAE